MAELAARLAEAAKRGDATDDLVALIDAEHAAGAGVDELRAAVAEAGRLHQFDPEAWRAIEAWIDSVPDSLVTPAASSTHGVSADDETQIAPVSVETVGVGRIIKGRFVLERQLGAGGMGRVFKALDLRRQEARDRHPYVALKALSEQFSRHPAAFITLAREAKKAQALAHPNIIRVYDFDRDGVVIFMTMEFLAGRSLEVVTTRPSFSGMTMDEVLAIVKPAGDALAFAHNNGLVHCDFKPSNIFLAEDNQVKVIDFGIARAVRDQDQPEMDQTIFDVGTLRALSPLYASPQMMEEREPDARDDLFSLGCVTYELLTGQHPFGRTPALVARAKGKLPEKPAGITSSQWQALRRALAFEREDRQPSVDAFLAEFMAEKRNRFGLLLAGAGVAALAAGGLAYYQLATPPGPSSAISPTSDATGTPSPAIVGPQPEAPAATATTPARSLAAPPPPVLPSPSLIQAIIDKVPCAWLRSSADGDVVRISGIAARENDLGPARAVLSAMPGVHEVVSEVKFLGQEKCAALDLLGPLLQRPNHGLAVNFARPDATFYRGEKLMLSIDAPDRGSFLYVDYYYINKGQLWVVHMAPRPKQKPVWLDARTRLSLGQGGDWQVGPPYGTDLVTALAVPEPLNLGARAHVEPAAPYLAAIQKELDRFGTNNIGTLALVTTKP